MSNFQLKIASHPEAKAIISRLIAGDKINAIARDFHLAQSTVAKFRDRVLRPAALGKQSPNRQQDGQYCPPGLQYCKESVQSAKAEIPALVAGTSTADLVARKLGRYERILGMAEKKGDVSGWASVDRAETAALQLQAQLRGEVNQVHSQTTVQMLVYTPQVLDAGENESQVLEARAIENIEPPAPPVELPPPPVEKPARQPKPPKPPSRMQLLQKLSARERKEAIRLIGQGIDPFAPPPPPPGA